ncbi:MAG: hypothetical protein KDJ35_00575 [Alphaproteobacteria bacterium]|nr:hypothetical protein [Alphaproteobacteria bacterium]
MSNDENPAIKKALLTKMAYERTESYISAARAIMHIHREEQFEDDITFENLQHVLQLMSYEISALNGRLDHDVEELLGPSTGAAQDTQNSVAEHANL